jgi:chromosomal replication initiator protein
MGKEQILEEFFHTFNTLYDNGKQIVITSDRHPRNSTLPDRLRSRFEWGLLTDIQPPDVETRLAILRTNAAFAPTAIPESVLEFIAGQVSDNIRELEGALTRITAYAALHAQDITLDMAQDVLQDLSRRSQPRMLTAEEIIQETAAACNITPAEVLSSSRRRDYVRGRQIAMYLTRDLTDLSLPKIGAKFGGRDHTTVMHGIDKVKKLMASDKEVFDQVTALSQKLRQM